MNIGKDYEKVRSGGAGFYEQDRGLITVWGGEAVRFLDGLISNDVKTLQDGARMLAAFPNAQGRLLAAAGVRRRGDRYLIETEAATREKVFQYLYRFTFAGDFFVEDLTAGYKFFEVFGPPDFDVIGAAPDSAVSFSMRGLTGIFVPLDASESFRQKLLDFAALSISDETYDVLRIEFGIPRYGVDIDEGTIVPEIGIEEMISYNKGCYIGQEIIARIHFRGHIAKKLTGLVMSEPPASADGLTSGMELSSFDNKNAGRITSVAYSPTLQRTIALAYVRYDYLKEGTELISGEAVASVKDLPFITRT